MIWSAYIQLQIYQIVVRILVKQPFDSPTVRLKDKGEFSSWQLSQKQNFIHLKIQRLHNITIR